MPALKTAPRGYAKDHPRIELLRQKGLVGYRTLTGTALADGDGVTRLRGRDLHRVRAAGRLAGQARRRTGPPQRAAPLTAGQAAA